MAKKNRNQIKNKQLPKDAVKKTFTTNKTFTYEKGQMRLSFTLNIEAPKDMSDFKDLLELGILDIEEILKK